MGYMRDRYSALGNGVNHGDQPTVQLYASRSALAGKSGISGHTSAVGHQQGEAADAIHDLLVGYGAALEYIAARPGVEFLPPRAIVGGWISRTFPLPYANFLASILATQHVAARIEMLIQRGHRIRALNPGAPNPVDIDRLKNFKKSLSPVKLRTLAVWAIVLGLVVAFPVARVIDECRALAPEVTVCSQRYSLRAAASRFVGVTSRPPTAYCHLPPRYSVVQMLTQVAHLKLDPGGVIDTFSSTWAKGVVTLLLLAATCVLSISLVLLISISGFQIKRLIFSLDGYRPFLIWPPDWSEIRSSGIYRLEMEAFDSINIPYPQEVPLDLIAKAGILVLPLMISTDFAFLAALSKLDSVTRMMLVTGAAMIIGLIILRISWIMRIWRSRSGARLMEPRQRSLPDGSLIRMSGNARTLVVMMAGLAAIEISAIDAPDISFRFRVVAAVLLAPVFSWSFAPVAWYRLHRELAAYGRYMLVPMHRRTALCTLPPLAFAAFCLTSLIWASPPSDGIIVSLLAIGFFGMPVSLYRMGRDVERLRQLTARRKKNRWRARAAGIGAVLTGFIPLVSILYFQHSLGKVYRQMITRSFRRQE
jgi:hypothetical protein